MTIAPSPRFGWVVPSPPNAGMRQGGVYKKIEQKDKTSSPSTGCLALFWGGGGMNLYSSAFAHLRIWTFAHLRNFIGIAL